MVIQIDIPPPLTTTRVESLAAFLLWSDDSVQAPIMVETEIEIDHQTLPRRSSSPYPHVAPPAPDLPSGTGTLKRRNIYNVSAANSDQGGINDVGALGSLTMNAQSSATAAAQLPLLVLHEQGLYHEDALHQAMASNVSPSCTRTVLHKLPSARSGGSSIPRLPFLRGLLLH